MNEIRTYTITLHGCDDSTKFNMDLTYAEAQLVQRIAELTSAYSDYECMLDYQCMPTLTIELIEPEPEPDYERDEPDTRTEHDDTL